MANPEHLGKLREGVKAWNEWRETHPEMRPDLTKASLSRMGLSAANLFEADLEGANLLGVDLSRAILSEANLFEANLEGANLLGVDLSRAILRRANLMEANLGGANLLEADLRLANLERTDLFQADLNRVNLSMANLNQANLSMANLTQADFAGALIAYTTFGNVDLSHSRGLEKVRHLARSTIGIDTLQRSQGKIPLSFLRGCGVPEIFIEYMPSLFEPGAIQFYSCFISYSTKDQEFADRIYADLQNKGVRCWFAPHDVQGGKKLHEQIDDAIRMHERLLLILSPHSMASKWVKTEIRNARRRELAEKKRVLFPVRLASYEALRDWKLFDADEGEDLATEIREFYIPDFSEWKNHDSYQKEFEKLLRDLRTEESKS